MASRVRPRNLFAQAGAGQHLHGEAVELGGKGAGGAEQGGGVGVAEEPWQRSVADGHVTGEDGVAGRCIGVVPFDDAVEEAAQVSQAHTDGCFGRAGFAAVADAAGQEGFEAFDVGPADIGNARDVGVVVGEVDGQVAQSGVDQRDAARSHTDRDLGQVAAQRGHQLRGAGGQLVPVRGATRGRHPGRWGVCEDTECGQGGCESVQRCRPRPRDPPIRAGVGGGEVRRCGPESSGVQHVWACTGRGEDFGQGAPLVFGLGGGESQRGCGALEGGGEFWVGQCGVVTPGAATGSHVVGVSRVRGGQQQVGDQAPDLTGGTQALRRGSLNPSGEVGEGPRIGIDGGLPDSASNLRAPGRDESRGGSRLVARLVRGGGLGLRYRGGGAGAHASPPLCVPVSDESRAVTAWWYWVASQVSARCR